MRFGRSKPSVHTISVGLALPRGTVLGGDPETHDLFAFVRPAASRPQEGAILQASYFSRLGHRIGPRADRACLPRQHNRPICRHFNETGATGLEPATSGVTGRSWYFRAEPGVTSHSVV